MALRHGARMYQPLYASTGTTVGACIAIVDGVAYAISWSVLVMN